MQSSNASAISNNAIGSIAIRKERISNASKISYLQLGEIFESGEGNRPVPEESFHVFGGRDDIFQKGKQNDSASSVIVRDVKTKWRPCYVRADFLLASEEPSSFIRSWPDKLRARRPQCVKGRILIWFRFYSKSPSQFCH